MDGKDFTFQIFYTTRPVPSYKADAWGDRLPIRTIHLSTYVICVTCVDNVLGDRNGIGNVFGRSFKMHLEHRESYR